MNRGRSRSSRRKFLAGAALGVIGLPIYGRWVEPRWLGLSRRTIEVSGATSRLPLTILHLSDFHASEVVGLDYIGRAIRLGLEQRPDLICVTGDFITGRYTEPDRYVEVLSRLARAAPCFACLGNHDGGFWARAAHGYADTDWVRGVLVRSGIRLLHNASASVEVKGWRLQLVGVGDLWAEELAPGAAFAGVEAGSDRTTIVLCHNPDGKDQLQSRAWQVMLCGHTHGGQLALPLIGTPFAPVTDPRFVEGLHRWDQRWIHITRGVGNVYGFRFNCRPEISLVTMV